MPYIVPDYIHEPLYICTAVFDPIRFRSRWKHYQRFAKMVKDAGGVLVTVEAAFGERHHALDEGITQHGTLIHGEAPTKPTEFHKALTTHPHQYIKVRTDDEVWLKENLINIGISRLPAGWKYVAWVDADVAFTRPNWVGETIHQLQHYKLIQMFSHATDVGPRYAPVDGAHHTGFMFCYIHGVAKPDTLPGGFGPYYGRAMKGGVPAGFMWHPGFAWAARREAIDELGGLMDFPILGAADNHMAHALIGCAAESVHPDISASYRRRVLEWEWRAEHHIRRNVGYMSGLILHYWHGKKVDRRYWDRWKILVDNGFDPDLDLKYDAQGVLQLVDRFTPRSIKLRDGLMDYLRKRNEDSIDVE